MEYASGSKQYKPRDLVKLNIIKVYPIIPYNRINLFSIYGNFMEVR